MNKLLLFIGIFFINFLPIKSDEFNSKNFIIAKVGSKIITNYDVKNKIIATLLIADNEINQKNIDNLKREVLENLIILRLKQIELENHSFKVNPQRLTSFLNRISRNDIDKLKDNFNVYNLDFNNLKKEIEIELKWRQFIYKNYSKKIKIDEKSLEEELNSILNSRKNNNKEVNLSEIVVFQNSNESNEKIISKIIEEIKNNGFENTALKFSVSNSSSEKGNLGWINIETLSEKISSIVQKIEVGEISEPIMETNTILFLKLNNIRKFNSTNDREKLKNNLILQKQNEIFNLYSNSHLSKLKNNSLIEYK